MFDRFKLFLTYIENVFIGIDQLLNAVLLGKPDETLSSRAYRADISGKLFGSIFRPLIDTIFFWQKEHCKNSYLSEVHKRQLPLHFSKI